MSRSWPGEASREQACRQREEPAQRPGDRDECGVWEELENIPEGTQGTMFLTSLKLHSFRKE